MLLFNTGVLLVVAVMLLRFSVQCYVVGRVAMGFLKLGKGW